MSVAGSDMERRVRETVALCFGVPFDDLDRSTRRDDVAGWDSVGHLNLMLMLEEVFDVRLDVDDMRDLTSVDAIVRFVER